MRRIALVVLAVVAVACGGDDDAGSDGAIPAWVDGLTDADDLRADSVDGVTFYVSDSEGIVFVEDCDLADNDEGTGITQSGGEYGPTPRNQDGTGGENGYATVCPS